MNDTTRSDLIDRIAVEKRRRPYMWTGLALVIGCSATVDVMIIRSVCSRHSLTLSEIASLGRLFGGGAYDTGLYAGSVVAAAYHFHFLLLTVLLSIGLVALLIRYHRCQDLALQLHQSAVSGSGPGD